MTPLEGWIKYHRKSMDSAVWNLPPGQYKVWDTILLLANNTDRKWWDGTEEVEIPRGSFVTSEPKLAEKAKVSRKTVRGALANLLRLGSIRAKRRAKKYTLIEVVNFKAYQGYKDRQGQEEGQVRAKQGPSEGHNVRMKNERIDRKRPIADVPPSTSKKGKKIHPETDPCISLFSGEFFQKFERTYQVEWGRDRKLMSGLLQGHGPEVVKNLIPLFFRFAPSWVRENGQYTIPVFRKEFNSLQALKGRGDI